MKNIKTTLIIIVSLVLAAVTSVASTLAYLGSTAEDVNTMTIGDVEIVQEEYQRAGKNDDGIYGVEEFEQLKPLYPVPTTVPTGTATVDFKLKGVNAADALDGQNIQDKFVFVKNTGGSDAYVRTIVAYEIGNLDPTRFNDVIHITEGSTESWERKPVEGIVKIGDSNYLLVEYLYKTALQPDLYTAEYSLGQVYMDHEATNEDCKALDGNGNGTYDILVVSQGVQTVKYDTPAAAFADTFGNITAKSHPWVDKANIPVWVSTEKDLKAKLGSSNFKYVMLKEDIQVSGALIVEGSKTLDLNGHSIADPDPKGTSHSTGILVRDEKTELTITGNGEINIPYAIVAEGGTVNINDVKVNAKDVAVQASKNGKVNIYDGTYYSANKSKNTLNIYYGPNDLIKDAAITVYGGTIIDYEPSDYIAKGYEVTSETKEDGKTYYTVIAK